MKIAIINGPNLNLTGKREPEIYGTQSFDQLYQELELHFPKVNFSYFQSNVEGELIDELQQKGFSYDGIILNAGAYTHTSIALADTIKAIKTPVIEVHLSNLLSRESLRHLSLTGVYCAGTIMGLGMRGYVLAVTYFVQQQKNVS